MNWFIILYTHNARLNFSFRIVYNNTIPLISPCTPTAVFTVSSYPRRPPVQVKSTTNLYFIYRQKCCSSVYRRRATTCYKLQKVSDRNIMEIISLSIRTLMAIFRYYNRTLRLKLKYYYTVIRLISMYILYKLNNPDSTVCEYRCISV